MNIKHHKLLHYVLITLLIFAPLRSVFSAQLMACDMKASPVSGDVTSSVMHGMNMLDSASVDDGEYQNGQTVKSCCGDAAACKGDCHFAVSASLLLHAADYSPTLLATVTFDTISSAVLMREIIPPSRPPLFLHS